MDRTINLSPDTLFAVLAHPRRRYTLHLLVWSDDDVVDFDELTFELAAWENEADDVQTSEDHLRQRIATDLHHMHLPVLEDVGLVEYDRRSGAIRYRECPPLRLCLDRTRAVDVPE